MPAPKKRIALTVPDHIDVVLTDLSKLTGTPKTALILELIDSAMPMMKQTLEAIQHAQEGRKGSAMDVMASLLKDAGFQLDEVQHDFFNLKKGMKKDDSKGS